MIDGIDNGLLLSDLDARHFSLLNVGGITPPPPNLVPADDTRLSDARPPLPGSVTDDSVAVDAAIAQSKLLLNGVMPPAWFGTTDDKVARGDLTEYLANKGQPNGYAPLDGSAKVPAENLPDDVGTGTLTSIDLTMPAEFLVAGGPVTGSGTIAVTWDDAPAESWFGNSSGSLSTPIHNTAPLPVGLIPNLDASKIISGTLNPARLPAAVGVGVSHAPGAVPDPGAGGTADDYLARDMTYQPKPGLSIPYQPDVDDPTFTSELTAGGHNVILSSDTDGSSLFYSLTSGSVDFVPFTEKVFVPTGDTIWGYAARLGFNNSNVVSATP